MAVGISLIRVCTDGSYRAYVALNYQPFSGIRKEDPNGWISRGAVWFKSTVIVGRGLIPNLEANWSSRSGIRTVMIVHQQEILSVITRLVIGELETLGDG